MGQLFRTYSSSLKPCLSTRGQSIYGGIAINAFITLFCGLTTWLGGGAPVDQWVVRESFLRIPVLFCTPRFKASTGITRLTDGVNNFHLLLLHFNEVRCRTKRWLGGGRMGLLLWPAFGQCEDHEAMLGTRKWTLVVWLSPVRRGKCKYNSSGLSVDWWWELQIRQLWLLWSQQGKWITKASLIGFEKIHFFLLLWYYKNQQFQ